MDRPNFDWIRWDRMRWDFVNSIMSMVQTHSDATERLTCTGPSCCLGFAKSLQNFGIEIYCDDSDVPGRLDFKLDLYTLVTNEMRDGMSMISTHVLHGLGHPLEGFMEVPMAVGDVIHSEYFSRGAQDHADVHSTHEPDDEARELLYAFAHLAFPNEWLRMLHKDHLTVGHKSTAKSQPYGWDANARMAQLFEAAGYAPPLLSVKVVEDLVCDEDGAYARTSHFSFDEERTSWDPIAGYHLGMAMTNASLDRFWNDFSERPDAFVYSEHGNQGGTGMGFVFRSPTLFVSQQVWESGANGLWNRCTRSFNKHLASLLNESNSSDSAMVIFSDYRDDAYIVSSVESSWDEYAPTSAVMGPLPKGFGIVGVWNNFDENRYTPRSFEEIIKANYSEEITACARYLKDCLEAVAENRRGSV